MAALNTWAPQLEVARFACGHAKIPGNIYQAPKEKYARCWTCRIKCVAGWRKKRKASK